MRKLVSIFLLFAFLSLAVITVQADIKPEESIATSVAISDDEIFIVNAKNELWVYTSPSQAYGMSVSSGDTIWRNELRKLMDNVAQVHCSQGLILVLKTDGTLWRLNYSYSSTYEEIAEYAPRQIDANVKTISQWNYNTIYLKNDSTLWQLDYNTLAAAHITDDVILARATFSGGLFIKSDQSLWGWDLPFKLSENDESRYLKDIHKLMEDAKCAAVDNSSGSYFVIKTDDSLWSWGSNTCGELGNGGLYDEKRAYKLSVWDEDHPWHVELDCYTPSKIMENVKAVYETDIAIYAVTRDGNIWTWGDSHSIQVNKNWETLQDLDYTRTVPREAEGEFQDIEAIKIEYSTGYLKYVIVKRDGSVWAKGKLFYGPIGNDENNQEFVLLMNGRVAGQSPTPGNEAQD